MVTTNEPQQFCVRWNSYQSNLQAAFPKLLDSAHFVDVTLACENEMIKCHKVVLSACSTYFEKLLLDNPCQHPIIFMKDMKFHEIQSLVDFMYKGEVNVTQDELPSLLKSAEALQIRGLCGSDQPLNQHHLDAFKTQTKPVIASHSTSKNNLPTPPQSQSADHNNSSSIKSPNDLSNKSSTTTQHHHQQQQQQLPTPVPSSSVLTPHQQHHVTADSALPTSSQQQQQQVVKKEESSSSSKLLDSSESGGHNPSSSECDSNDGAVAKEEQQDMKEEPGEDDSYYEGDNDLMDTEFLEEDGQMNSSDMSKQAPEFAIANVSCQYDGSPGSVSNRRIRRSEEELRRAAECITRGQTFQTVSDQFGIPISTIRFYMARKGILPRRKRGRACSGSSNSLPNASMPLMHHHGQGGAPHQSTYHSPGNTSPIGPPYHIVHYKLPQLGVSKLK